MSQNLTQGSFRDFLSLRHPNHFVLADANNTNVIITYRFLAAPVQANSSFFSGILTVYFNCKYFPYYTRELLECLLGFRLLGEIPAGAIIQSTGMATQMQLEVILVGNRIATHVL